MHSALPRQTVRILAAFTVTLSALGGCNLQIGTGIEVKDTWTRSYAVKPGSTLEVHEVNGSIQIAAADGDKIEVTATRIAKAPTEDAAKTMLQEFTIGETATDSRVELDSTPRGMTFSFNRSRRVDYVIKVPRSTAVTIKTTNSDVDVRGIGGMFRVEAVNGKISGAGLNDGADISTVNGEITLDFAKLGDAGVRCKTTNGEVGVTLPTTTKATVTGHIVNGDISTDNLKMEPADQRRGRIEGTINGGGAEIRLETTNGAVRLTGK